MAKTKLQKQEIIKDLADKFDRAKSVIFTAFNGLTAKEGEELRKQLKAEQGEYYVIKKTLLDLTLRARKLESLEAKNFAGRVAAVFGYEDEVTPAKIIGKFRKDHEEKIDFIAGILENKALDRSEVEAMSVMPSKLELKAKLVGSLNAPISGLVNVMAGNLRGLLYVLNAIKEKKSV